VADIGEDLHVESSGCLRQDFNCPAALLRLEELICSRNGEEDGFCDVVVIITASEMYIYVF
jgi:hypothetical protein